ncbi:MAG: hypothetical protein HY765_04360 [Rhodomicrobium sp.]|nr:hypothetical protein [Rhodomicrobium sp.]
MKTTIGAIFAISLFAAIPAHAHTAAGTQSVSSQAAGGIVKVDWDDHSRQRSHYRRGSHGHSHDGWHNRRRSHYRWGSHGGSWWGHDRWRSHNRRGSDRY